jgi:hypothetical protein
MNTADLYSRRSMLAALNLVPPVKRFLTNTFFSQVEQHDTDTIDIDVTRGGRRMAPFVHAAHEGKPKQRAGFKTLTYRIPYIKELFTLSAHEILQRQPGQGLWDPGLSPAAQALQKMAVEMKESSDSIDRRVEWMCAQLLSTGSVRCVGEGTDETIDFLLPTAHNITLSGAALWSAPTTATPLTNLRNWKRIQSQKGKVTTDFIFGTDAYDAFMTNTAEVKGVNSMFDKTRITIGQIDPQMQADGVTYVGRINEIGVDIWVYEEWYADDQADNKEKPMIDPKKVIGIARSARRTLHYGAIKDLDATGAFAKFPKSWKCENPSAMVGLIQSAPLPALHDIEGIIVGKVIA